VKRVCLVSGGTGGHLMPALALARALQQRGHEPLLVTEGRPVERELLHRSGGDLDEVDLPAERPSRLGLPWWLLRATLRARKLLQRRAVDCVVSTGGRPSLPMGLAARSLGMPLFLLEQNVVPGRANRWLLPFARRLYLGLPAAGNASARTLLTGTPLRPGLFAVERASARAELDLDPDQPVVLVTGGSQGAHVLNQIVPAALATLDLPLQVLHLTGLGRDDEVRRRYAATADHRLRLFVWPVTIDMDRMLGAADLVICRGGGTTIAELMAAGRAAVIVPYPHHKDRQQSRNAAVLVRAGAALVVEETALTPALLAQVVGELLRQPERLLAMAAAARRAGGGDATMAILDDMTAHGGLG